MPEGTLPGMDKQAGAGPAFSSNTAQSDGISSNSVPNPGTEDKPQSPAKRSHKHSGKHCDSCRADLYFNSQIIDHDSDDDDDKMNAFSQLARAVHIKQDDLPSPRFTTYCGVTLDQAQRGQISEFHILENDGYTDNWSQEWDAMAVGFGGFEELAAMISNGLAAVRVRVGNAHLRGSDAQTSELSGFRVSRDMVITCAHFTDWTLAGNSVQTFLTGRNGICEAIQARDVEGGGWKHRLGLRLWAIHKDWDIAVFRVTDRPRDDCMKSVIKKEDIYLATPEERRNLANAAQAPCWSVGYNAAINLDELRKRFKEFFSRRHEDEKLEIIRRYNYNGDKPPSPDFLQADSRTVSFGTKIDHPPDAKANQECVELSAWYGRSGSMVCAVRDGRPVVVGMVQGGDKDSDCNLILLFNTEMKDWLDAATDLSTSPDPWDLGRRIVMA